MGCQSWVGPRFGLGGDLFWFARRKGFTCLGLGFEALPGGGEDLAVVVGEGVGSHDLVIGFEYALGWIVVGGCGWCGWL